MQITPSVIYSLLNCECPLSKLAIINLYLYYSEKCITRSSLSKIIIINKNKHITVQKMNGNFSNMF